MSKDSPKRTKKNSSRRPALKQNKVPAPIKVHRSLELTDNPRLAAFRVLKDTAEGRTPEDSLESQGRLLSPLDLALATSLVYKVLRHQSLLDSIIKIRLTSGKASDELMLVLRLGLAQLFFFSRLGDHAVVMETVNLAKAVVSGRHGVVNAVLRGLLRDREAGLPWPPEIVETGNAAKDLSIQYSYQLWYVELLLSQFNPEETELLLSAGNEPTPPTLRVNTLKTDRDSLAKSLPFPSAPTSLSPWGLCADGFFGNPGEWPGFDEGLFAIQDEASQIVGLLAGSLEGKKALDACAGLGTKGLHLACLNPRADIVSMDKDQPKLDLLMKEAARLGCSNVRTEARDFLANPLPPAEYDLVLMDAPCSGMGVVRRRPDLKWSKNADDVQRLAKLQFQLLEAAAGAVKPGGRLLYGICSFSRQEGPENIKKFLETHQDFVAAPPEEWPIQIQAFLSAENTLTLLPHRQNTDGFFWAMLNKIAD